MRAAQRLLAKHGAHTEGYQLVLLRHGQSEWNASKRECRRGSELLTASPRRQDRERQPSPRLTLVAPISVPRLFRVDGHRFDGEGTAAGEAGGQVDEAPRARVRRGPRSVLKRAVRTLWTALHSCNQHWIPVNGRGVS